MFNMEEKKHIAHVIEAALMCLEHPEMPKEKPQFTLIIAGKESWSWAEIKPNWTFTKDSPPGVSQWNENVRKLVKEDK